MRKFIGITIMLSTVLVSTSFTHYAGSSDQLEPPEETHIIEDAIPAISSSYLSEVKTYEAPTQTETCQQTEVRILSIPSSEPSVEPVIEQEVLDPELDMMARIIFAEAGNQSDLGQRAVACVILNRVESPHFSPDTIQGVLAQKNQFSGYKDKNYNSSEIPDRCYDNAKSVLEGLRELPNNVLFFKATYCNAQWSYDLYEVIGDHEFYSYE